MGVRTAELLLLLFSSSTGTYVSKHCSIPHSMGECVSCTEGEGYTAHANGLEECLMCRQCKDVVEKVDIGKINHTYGQRVT
ncbi:UNVERIFIED_CONTAM: hypothetical protein H355_004467 [Colinus virginianus]|nr:hypothetical protein H355_004467 [Colinus virginianus]